MRGCRGAENNVQLAIPLDIPDLNSTKTTVPVSNYRILYLRYYF